MSNSSSTAKAEPLHASNPPPIDSPRRVLKLLRLPTHCYNNNAEAATERTHPATAPALKPTTAQRHMRSTHGRIQRRRLHRLRLATQRRRKVSTPDRAPIRRKRNHPHY